MNIGGTLAMCSGGVNLRSGYNFISLLEDNVKELEANVPDFFRENNEHTDIAQSTLHEELVSQENRTLEVV